MNLKKYSLLFIVFFPLLGIAQEEIHPLKANYELINEKSVDILKNAKDSQALSLPFFDDFSNNSKYPSSSNWSDINAYVNNNYPVLPPSKGVATFDAADNKGHIYDYANPYGFSSDTLTSLEIRLDSLFGDREKALTVSDSLYLSFYYQPQGFGNAPESADSLILEFLAVNENDTIIIEEDPNAVPPILADTIIIEGWRSVWNTKGQDFETFYADGEQNFKQVMIPITDSARFFNKHFRFRFRNIASIEGNNLDSYISNVDQWNVDYVLLDAFRSYDDTEHTDIVLTSQPGSFIQEYTAMPWWQYESQFFNVMKSSVDMKISNLSGEYILGDYKYEIFNGNGASIYMYDGGESSLPPFAEMEFTNHAAFANPPIFEPGTSNNFIFPTYGEAQDYVIQHTLEGDASVAQTSNDTLIYKQLFRNYYAYDDGSAETGYGFGSAYGEFAMYFEVHKKDTLRGVQMMFNHIFNEDQTPRPFTIKVWEYSNGNPGDLLYSQTFNYPITYDDDLFNIYKFDEYIVLNPRQEFFIGLEQVSDEFLNIGFDRNNDKRERVYINVSGNWNNSSIAGVPMLRPVMGGTISNGPYGEDEIEAFSINLYPNPVVDGVLKVNIEGQPSDYDIEIFGVNGQMVYRKSLSQRINCNNFVSGVYFARIIDKRKNAVVVKKLIISNN